MLRFFMILWFLSASVLFAEDGNALFTTRENIKEQRIENKRLAEELEKIKSNQNVIKQEASLELISQQRLRLEQLQLDMGMMVSRVESIERHLLDENKRVSNYQTLLQKQSNPLFVGSDTEAQKQALLRTQHLLNESLDYIKALQQQKEVINEGIQLLKQQKHYLDMTYQRDNERYLSIQQQNQAQDADKSILYRLSELEKKRKQLIQQSIHHQDRSSYLDKNIELALIARQISFQNILLDLSKHDRHLQELQFADFSNVSLERINQVQEDLIKIEYEINEFSKQIKEQFLINNEQFGLYSRQRKEMPQAIKSHQERLGYDYQEISALIENLRLNIEIISKTVEAQHHILSKNYLTKRYAINQNISFQDLGTMILRSWTSFIGQYAVALQTVKHYFSTLSRESWGAIILILLSAGVGTLALISRINHIVLPFHSEPRLPFAKRLILFIYNMYKYNLPYLVILLLVYLMVYFAKLPAPSSHLIVLLPAILLVVAVPHFAAKMLVSSQLIKTPEQSNIVTSVTVVAFIGILLFSLVMLSQWVLIENNENTTNFYRWLFGAYVLLASYPIFILLMRTWRYMNEYYEEYFIYRILRVLITLLPIGSALFGLLSVAGYLNIAWLFAKYFMIFIVYALAWAAFLATCKDTALWAKRYALKNTSNGLFWAQDVINPLHTIFRYAGLFFAVSALLDAYQWDSRTPIIHEVFNVLKSPIFGKEDSQFTTLNIILMATLIYFIFRIGGWVRSFAYRWVFAKINDLGIRNSFAVFSQYATVTLGFLLALRIIGLDLTAFTVFAGALGVGIGFGMQTIANNFISGILLLIERPLRNGDIITVGKYEGRVERIGMRSLTITTFNNESVILPNSDFVTSAFMNWSHSDQVVRTILYLDLSYRHAPEIVRQAFTEALLRLSKDNYILHSGDFEFGVFAYDCSERGIRYRVQYFMNMDIHKLMDIRHLVVNTLWKACFEHGFEIAYPKHDVFFPNQHQFMDMV